MPESLIDIIFRTKKTGNGDKDTEKGLGGLKDAFQELTGISLTTAGVLAAAGAAVVAVGKAASETVNEYSEYVETVDKVSMATGMAAEETSRLIQLADDFRVDQGQLTTAMKMALQNGFEPTVENLAKLSDEYLAIQSPAERAAKLQEIFGKQWANMVPLLERGGDAIREASDGIDESLVVTQDAIDANREYIKATDDLSDAWMGFKYALVRDVMPALADFLSTQAAALDAVQDGKGKIEGLAGASSILALEQQQAAQAVENWGLRYQGMADAIPPVTEAIEEQTVAVEASADAVSVFKAAIGGTFKKELDTYQEKVAKIKDENEQLAEKIEALKDKRYLTAEQRSELEDMETQLGDNQQALIDLADEHEQAMKRMAFNMLMERAASDGLTENEVNNMAKIAVSWGLWDQKTADVVTSVNENMGMLETDRPEELRSILEGIMGLPSRKNFEFRISVTGDPIPAFVNDGRGGIIDMCFVGETPVNVFGGWRPMQELAVGDQILVYTDEGSLEQAPIQAIATRERSDLLQLTLSNGWVIRCTPDHPWKAGGKWVHAGKLKPGMQLRSITGEVTVAVVEPYPGAHQVFDLTVDHPEHTFLVGDCQVHNKEARAEGGPVYPGKSYVVGENGPEVLTMGASGGYVYPNPGGQPAAKAGLTIENVHINNGMDLEMLKQTVTGWLNS